MPSAYCNVHPESSVCFINPNYNPFPGGGIINSPVVVTPADVPTILNTPNLPTMSTTPLPWPKQTNTTSLDKWLTTGLSAIALLTRQDKIPTAQTTDTVNADLYRLAALRALEDDNDTGTTLSGKVETWIGNNKGVTAIGLGAVLLYFMQPSKPRK